MKTATVLLLTLVLATSLAIAIPTPAHAGVRYLPKQGDFFNYHETIDLNQGTGAYDQYTEHETVDGSEHMNTVYTNGTVAAHWSYTYYWSNSSSYKTGSPQGNFTWDRGSFLYEHSTDNQVGYVNPTVWFYMDNTTLKGGRFSLLDTPMNVQSVRTSYKYLGPLNFTTSGYVYAIQTTGTSSYQRNDVYGNYNAPYTWNVYFDPNTGYVIGYDYTEHDTGTWQGQAAGFTWTDIFYVTGASYQLQTAPVPPPDYTGLIIVLAAFLIPVLLIILVALLVIRRRHRMQPLREHPSHAQPIGTVQYSTPPPPPPYGQQPGIDLTPKQQPPVQQIVVKEIVKVKCKYCGALIDGTVAQCPFCGAPRT